MKRIPEPELMLTAEQAEAYAAADFAAPHQRVVELFRRAFPGFRPDHLLELGCGPGDIVLRFARAFPRCRVLGVDGSPAMLKAGRRLLAREPALARRITLVKGLLQDWQPPQRTGAVISNALLHHLHDPRVLWSAVRRCAAPGARVFVVDLRRPASRREAEALMRRHAAGEPAVLQEDFFNSLCAAFTTVEVRAQLRAAGLAGFRVRQVGNRHLVVSGRMPKPEM